MKNVLRLAVIALLLLGSTAVTAQYKVEYTTRLSPGKTITIVRHPPPSGYYRGKLDALPWYKEDSQNQFPVDVRSYDLSALDLKGREYDLYYADFDSKTKWPADLATVCRFDPDKIMALGKDPGLGVRQLHKQGINGKGVAIAIIDQTLLTDHVEYKDRLRMYEEIHNPSLEAQMHGPAVASIAVGKTVGVAPEADLYYIAEMHGTMDSSGQFAWDFNPVATSIDRIIEINKRLPKGKRIRVISISLGWVPTQVGYKEVVAAVERAKKQGIFVVSSSLQETYRDQKMSFHGLGREPLKDPNDPSSRTPGLWWQKQFYEQYESRFAPAQGGSGRSMLLIPMDSRCVAGPSGVNDYAYYRSGGWSWSIPYIAGLYALACQVDPKMTPARFWTAALATGDTVTIEHGGKQHALQKIVNPKKLIDKLRAGK